jgi:tetratricopeptide (TPR) repeat protein
MIRVGTKRGIGRTASALVVMLAIPALALAHSGGGGGGGGGSAGSGHAAPSASGGAASAGAGSGSGSSQPGHSVQPGCDVGQVPVGGVCQRVHAGMLPDDELYRLGRALAVAGYYTRALPILEAVRRTDDPMVYTMRGYALRKLGHFDSAMALYRHALAIDPGNVNTHEYIGEGYVQTGHLDLARLELVQVARGCGGRSCEQY